MKEKSLASIDSLELDREWVGQPKRYLKYARQLADAKRAQLEAEAELEVVAAELSRDIRDDPSAFDVPKLTEPVVEATIKLQKEYQLALTAVNNAKHLCDVLKGAVEALQHRKFALQDLVELQLSGYFAEPRTRRISSSEAIGNMEKRSVRQKGVDRSNTS